MGKHKLQKQVLSTNFNNTKNMKKIIFLITLFCLPVFTLALVGDSAQNGQYYTISQLKSFPFYPDKAVNFSTGGYFLEINQAVASIWSKGPLPTVALFVEKKNDKLSNGWGFMIDNDKVDSYLKDLKKGQLYDLKVRFDERMIAFYVVSYESVKNLGGSDVTIATSTVTDNPPVKSIFVRFINWFFGLFRKN